MSITNQDSEKNTLIGFIYSIALHALLILIYVGWTWITKEDQKKIGEGQHFSIIMDGWSPPDASPKNNGTSSKAVNGTPTSGIPIPVPNIEAPKETLPLGVIGNPFSTDTGSSIGQPGLKALQNSNTETTTIPENIAHPSKDIFIEVSEDAKPIQNIQAFVQYPESARRAHLEGKVSYSALIGKDGHVITVDIDKADYDIFKQSVIDALMRARFAPAMQGETPVEVWYSGTVSFTLSSR
jgi:TonB family protein